jgi:hypothetical protein
MVFCKIPGYSFKDAVFTLFSLLFQSVQLRGEMNRITGRRFQKSVSQSLPHFAALGINFVIRAPDVKESETERSAERYPSTKPFINS